MKKIISIILAVTFLLAVPISSSIAAGKHYGELKMIEANIYFLNPMGTCVADDTGITYFFAGQQLHVNIVYPSEYWGTYPLYFPAAIVPTRVDITNQGPRAIAKHAVVTEAYVINTDGSRGDQILWPSAIDNVEVPLGETKIVNASFVLPPAGKYLNIFSLKLYHYFNESNPDASLVLEEKAVFCPPDIAAELEGYGY